MLLVKPGSIILCTTRNRQVASRIGTIVAYDLNYLPDDFCWSLFKQHAFYEGERNYQNLQEIGWSIVKKCGGIPLIVSSLGRILRNNRDIQEWQRIAKMDSFIELIIDTEDRDRKKCLGNYKSKL